MTALLFYYSVQTVGPIRRTQRLRWTRGSREMLEQKKKNKTTNGASLEIGLKRRQYTQEKKKEF